MRAGIRKRSGAGPPDETLYQIQVYDGLIKTYRSGDLSATLAKLDAMLVSRTADRQLQHG